MISSNISNYFRPVSFEVYSAQESRRSLIERGDAAVQTAISSTNAKKEEAMLIDLRKDEQIVIELSDDSDEDDFVLEVSKEEQLEAQKRNYSRRPTDWKKIATLAIQESSASALRAYSNIIPGSTNDSKMTALCRWKKDLAEEKRGDVVSHRSPPPVYGNKVDLHIRDQVNCVIV